MYRRVNDGGERKISLREPMSFHAIKRRNVFIGRSSHMYLVGPRFADWLFSTDKNTVVVKSAVFGRQRRYPSFTKYPNT